MEVKSEEVTRRYTFALLFLSLPLSPSPLHFKNNIPRTGHALGSVTPFLPQSIAISEEKYKFTSHHLPPFGTRRGTYLSFPLLHASTLIPLSSRSVAAGTGVARGHKWGHRSGQLSSDGRHVCYGTRTLSALGRRGCRAVGAPLRLLSFFPDLFQTPRRDTKMSPPLEKSPL